MNVNFLFTFTFFFYLFGVCGAFEGPKNTKNFPLQIVPQKSTSFQAPSLSLSNLQVSVQGRNVQFRWDPSHGAFQYKLYCGTESRAYGATPFYQGPGTSHAAPNVKPNTYYCAVKSYNISGVATPYSNEVIVRVLTPAPALAASKLKGRVNGTSVHINWSMSPGATQYKLFCGTAPKAYGATPFYQGSGTSHVAPNVAPNTYYCVVKAYNDAGATTSTSNEIVLRVASKGKPKPGSFCYTTESKDDYGQVFCTSNHNPNADTAYCKEGNTCACRVGNLVKIEDTYTGAGRSRTHKISYTCR